MADNRPPDLFPEPRVSVGRLEDVGLELLRAIGEDPARDGLQDTPRRFAAWWQEFIDYDPGDVGTAFQIVTADQMVAVTGIRVYSLCEHHLLPFWADITIGYIATTRVLGLSKFARIAHQAAHRLQLQERLVEEIANAVHDATESEHVGVIARGEHLCMTMRGIRSPAIMLTSVLRGNFREDARTRAEFMALQTESSRG